MNHISRRGLALAVGGTLAGSVAFASLAFAEPGQRGPNPSARPAATATATTPASETLKTDLTYMREEERLARDVYTALAARYDGAAPMVNIKNSEQRHHDAVGTLLTRYGLADPSAGKQPGEYAVPEIQAMYDELMAQGSESLAAAYDVGIKIETADIADLERAIARTTEADAKRVFENLKRGSQNHLAAFEAAKAGRTVGVRDGSGPQAGRGGQQARGAGQADGSGPQAGARRGGPGQGQGQGRGMGPGGGDPANCVNR